MKIVFKKIKIIAKITLLFLERGSLVSPFNRLGLIHCDGKGWGKIEGKNARLTALHPDKAIA